MEETAAIWYNQLERFCTYLMAERNLSSHTLAAYRRDIAQWIEAKGSSLPHRVQGDDITQFLHSLRHLQRASLQRKYYALRSFFQFLVQEKVCSVNPAHDCALRPLRQSLPQVIPYETIAAVVEKHGEDAQECCLLACIELLYGCGLRVSECCHLRVGDLQGETLRVFGKGGKERVVPLGVPARQAVERYREYRPFRDPQEPLFLWKGVPLTRQVLWRGVRTLFQKVGVKVHPHTLRHCFATDLLKGGGDIRTIQSLLGHAHINTTQRYTRLDTLHLHEAFIQFHPRKE